MNAHTQEMKTRRSGNLAHIASTIGARILLAPTLLPLLAACRTPGAAQQTVVKAVARVKPLSATGTPLPTSTPAPTGTPLPTSTPVTIARPISIGTNGGEWQFDTATLELAAGEEVALTFNNGAKTTAHNWLLLSGGDDLATEINAAGEQAGEEAAYIPTDPRIIARTTGLVKGGQAETTTFIAPAAGRYVYLCTFPGHFELGMKGVLTVK